MATTFSAKDLAQECDTDPRSMRKFLRQHLPAEDQPGQGGRYVFTKAEVKKIKAAWAKAQKVTDAPVEDTKSKKGSKKSKVEEVTDREPDEDIVDLEEIDDPSLDDIDDEDLELELDDED
jgi:hypothetical protein